MLWYALRIHSTFYIPILLLTFFSFSFYILYFVFICTSLPFLFILYFVFICNNLLLYVLCYVDWKKTIVINKKYGRKNLE